MKKYTRIIAIGAKGKGVTKAIKTNDETMVFDDINSFIEKNMETKKLFNILTIVGNVTSTRWDTVLNLVECINNGGAKIIKKQWENHHKGKSLDIKPMDLHDINIWSTFDGTCINLFFTINKDELHCYVKIYDGESFGGYRKGLRFSAELNLLHDFIHKIEREINWELNCHFDNEYEKHLEDQKKKWINEMKLANNLI